MLPLPPPPSERAPRAERHPRRFAWRWLIRIAPVWAWLVAALVQLAITLPFWLYPSRAPFHDAHGDVYRGWPFIYGLDQGDVGGDEWGPFTTYFHPSRFAVDTLAALVAGLPVIAVILWSGRACRRVNCPG